MFSSDVRGIVGVIRPLFEQHLSFVRLAHVAYVATSRRTEPPRLTDSGAGSSQIPSKACRCMLAKPSRQVGDSKKGGTVRRLEDSDVLRYLGEPLSATAA